MTQSRAGASSNLSDSRKSTWGDQAQTPIVHKGWGWGTKPDGIHITSGRSRGLSAVNAEERACELSIEPGSGDGCSFNSFGGVLIALGRLHGAQGDAGSVAYGVGPRSQYDSRSK